LLGFAVTRFGDFAVGEELLNRELTESRALGDHWGVAAGLSTRGMQSYVCGDLEASRRDGEESFKLFHEAGDQWGQVQATAVLGRLAEIEGDYPQATRLHREGLRMAEELGLWTDASMRWSELGRITLLTGDYAGAEDFHERGRRLAVEQGDKPAEEFAEIGLALGTRRQGRLDRAESYLRRWLEWNRQFDAEYGAALILAELGFVAELRGDARGCGDGAGAAPERAGRSPGHRRSTGARLGPGGARRGAGPRRSPRAGRSVRRPRPAPRLARRCRRYALQGACIRYLGTGLPSGYDTERCP
jgi:tetratricopeptide (TPR) repeat protein